MLLGLFLSGTDTKLNIVIIPFKNSHCPISPLSVFSVADVTDMLDTEKETTLAAAWS